MTENGGLLFIPADPIGAVGKTRLIAVVNAMIESHTKGGALKWRDSLRDFFAPLSPTTPTFDPKIIYDHYEDRFVVVALERVLAAPAASVSAGNISRILVAVSRDGNPRTPTAADWFYTAIDSKTLVMGFETWADYPGFEADEEAVYVTANLFTFSPFRLFAGVRLWIIGKGVGTGGFYDGGPATATRHDPYADGGTATTTMPAQVFGPGGAGPGIGTYLVSYSGFTDDVDEFVQVVRVDDPLGTPTFTREYVNVGDIEALPSLLPDAPQPGTSALIEVNDRRALDAVWRDDALWLTATIRANSGPDLDQATAHWWRLSTAAVPGGPIALDDQGNIGGEDIAPGTFTFFAAVTVNRKGDVLFGFGASAPTVYAGAYAAGRRRTGPPGTVRASVTVRAGVDSYFRPFDGSSNRWGDYSGIALDPTNDDFVWVINMFADRRGTPTHMGSQDGRWGTAWGRFNLNGN